MKKMLVTINYDSWALASVEDAVHLLAIFQRAIRVKQQSYSGPYFAEDDQTPPVDSIALGDVAEKVDVVERSTAKVDDEPF